MNHRAAARTGGGVIGALAVLLSVGLSTGVYAAAASWTIVPSPTPAGHGSLSDVTCTNANDCWAVGSGNDFSGLPSATLIEHNSGHGWVIVPSPTPGGTGFAFLTGVACGSATDCWAVGAHSSSITGPNTALIEHFDGSSWSIVTSPNGPTSALVSVSCTDATNCWAVGSFRPYPGQTLVVHYNGTTWADVSTTSFANGASLGDVTCVDLNHCWAVGSFTDASFVNHTLIERYDGVAWAVTSSPDAHTGNGLLSGVTCTSTSNCWAVGFFTSPHSRVRPLTEHYNGSTWTVVSAPNGTFLNDVSCSSANDCWAVGGRPQTFIEHNTGSGWVIVASPNASHEENSLSGAECLSTGVCLAVGFYTVGRSHVPNTLIEQFTP